MATSRLAIVVRHVVRRHQISVFFAALHSENKRNFGLYRICHKHTTKLTIKHKTV